jgi:hypothetical protein
MTGFSVKALTVAVLGATLGTAMIGCSHHDAVPPPPPPAVAADPQMQAFEDAKAKGMAADMAKAHAAQQTQQH